MHKSLKRNRGAAIVLLVALVAVALAPAAEAGHRRVRYKGDGYYHRGSGVVRVVRRGPVFIERHSGAGPAIAGFIGGLVLGTVLSNAEPAPPPHAYGYYDPWCHERFVSLDAYGEHFCCHRHPRVIQVVELRSGRCVDEYGWRDGEWRSESAGDRVEVDPDWED